MSFASGDLVIINPDIFKTEEITDLHGDGMYPGLFKHFIFKVVSQVNRNNVEMLNCEVENKEVCFELIPDLKDVQFSGHLTIRVADAMPASNNIKIEYEIIKGRSREEVVKDLFVIRKKLKSEGKSIKHPVLQENWRQIRMARGELKGFQEEQAKVIIPKSRIEVMMDMSDLPKDDSEKEMARFNSKLRTLIRNHRNQTRGKPELEEKNALGGTLIKENGVYTKPNQFKNVFEEFLKNAFDIDKKPSDKSANYVGIELELIYSGDLDRLKTELARERLHKEVTIHSDQSVRACHNSGYQGLEVTVLVKESNLENVMNKLQKVFEIPEIDAYANRSCGLHVHLDQRNRDHTRAFKNLVRVQNIMRGSQPRGRVNNIHCKPNQSDEFKLIDERGDRFDKYFVVNPNAYQKFTTLEVRIHEGTTCAENIINWVNFLTSICDFEGVIPEGKYKLASEIVSLGVNIPANAVAYVDQRVNRFKSVS